MEEKVFETLSKINVNEHTEQKGKLTYLSWAWAWGIVKGYYPDASYKVLKSKAIVNGCENELNYFTDGRTAWVEVEVTIQGRTEAMYLPVMDYNNRSISIDAMTSFDVNKTIQRCLAKNVAINFGLGFYIYAGEDLPEGEEPKEEVRKATPRQIEILSKTYTGENLKKLLEANGIEKLEDMPLEKASSLISKLMERKGEK